MHVLAQCMLAKKTTMKGQTCEKTEQNLFMESCFHTMMVDFCLHNVYAVSCIAKDPTACKQYPNAKNTRTDLDYIPEFGRLHLHNIISCVPFGGANAFTRVTF